MEPRFNLADNAVSAKIGKRFAATSQLIMQTDVPKATIEFMSLRASQINGCGWCVNVHTEELAVAGEPAPRINLVAAWRHATVFSDAERAALALTEEGTRIADGGPGVSDETWAEAAKHYDEDRLASLVYVVAMINAANRLGVMVQQQGGAYYHGMFEGLPKP